MSQNVGGTKIQMKIVILLYEADNWRKQYTNTRIGSDMFLIYELENGLHQNTNLSDR